MLTHQNLGFQTVDTVVRMIVITTRADEESAVATVTSLVARGERLESFGGGAPGFPVRKILEKRSGMLADPWVVLHT